MAAFFAGARLDAVVVFLVVEAGLALAGAFFTGAAFLAAGAALALVVVVFFSAAGFLVAAAFLGAAGALGLVAAAGLDLETGLATGLFSLEASPAAGLFLGASLTRPEGPSER